MTTPVEKCRAVTPDEMPLLAATQLWKTYRRRGRKPTVALSGVSMEVATGETVGVVGETGSGKSTLGQALLGMLKTDSGQIQFAGSTVSNLSGKRLRDFRRSAQMVFQDPYDSLDPRIRIGRTVAEPLITTKVSRANRDAASMDALQRVGLGPEFASRYPHELSGGQRQRIGIARAIITRPRLLVLDEPVSALDVSVQAQILNLLNELQRELCLTYVFISHDLAVVRNVSDRLIVMQHGEVVESGHANAIFEEAKHPYTRALLAAVPSGRVQDRYRSTAARDDPFDEMATDG